MNENMKKRNEILAQTVIKGLESRNMTGYYAADKEEVLTVTFHRNTEEAPEVTLKYFAYDDTYDSLEINGTERFLVKAEDVDALVKQIKKAF